MNYQNPNPNPAPAAPVARMKMDDLAGALRRAGVKLPVVMKLSGRVYYSHIKTRIDGEELADANKRKLAHGGRVDSKPYFSLSISDAAVVPDNSLPPEVATFFEQRIVHKIHEDGTQSHVFYATSKSPLPASIGWGPGSGVQDPRTMPNKADQLEGELAQGLAVVIGMKIFPSAQGAGLGLDFVIVNEPPRYFTAQTRNADMEEALRAMGAAVPAPAAPAAPAPQAIPAPVAPVAPQAVNPMSSQPVSPVPPANPFMAPPAGDPAAGNPQYPPMTYART